MSAARPNLELENATFLEWKNEVSTTTDMSCGYNHMTAGNETFLTENITQDRKRFITQSKHMIF